MKRLVLLVSISFSIVFSSFSQNNLTIFLGTGFEFYDVTLIIGYSLDSTYQSDTLLYEEKIIGEPITGLSKTIHAKIPKKGRKDIKLIYRGKTYYFRFDRIRNNSQLKIEKVGEIDFLLYQKEKMKFH